MTARWQGSSTVGIDQGRVLARATAVIAAVCGVTAVVPFSPTAPRGLAAVLAVVGLGLSVLLRRTAHRLTVAQVHGMLVVVTALMTLCVAVATTPTGTVVTAITFIWVAMYAAAFQSRGEMLAHLALIAAGMAYGLWVAAPPSVGQTWFFLTATIGGVAWILNEKVSGLRQDATRDPLTGALTRRGFLDVLDREVAWAARTGEPLTIALLDLNEFKEVNDRHGHGAGDAVLAGLPRAWEPCLRPRDVLGRWGGDEFAVLMPGVTPDDAAAVVDRLRAATLVITFSAGVRAWGPGQSVREWLEAADAELYADKRQGGVPDGDDVRS